MKLALIDLGSNSARMSVATLNPDGSFTELFRRREMVRLSEGMDTDGFLKETPIKRTIAALSAFVKEAESEGAKVIAVATAAVRRAKNRNAFCAHILQEVGLPLHIISGEKEAFFDFQGVLSAFPEEKNCLITDVGGGSSEVILVKDGALAEKVSLPFGAMTLTDRYFRESSPETATQNASEEILSALGGLSFLNSAKGLPVIGMGGSAGALPDLDRAIFACAGQKTHGHTLSPRKLRELFSVLQKTPPEVRTQKFGLEKGRADTILAGILPNLLVLEFLDSPCLKICTAGLREGIFYLLAGGEDLGFSL